VQHLPGRLALVPRCRPIAQKRQVEAVYCLQDFRTFDTCWVPVLCDCSFVVSPGAADRCTTAVLVSLDCAAVAKLFVSTALRTASVLLFDSALGRHATYAGDLIWSFCSVGSGSKDTAPANQPLQQIQQPMLFKQCSGYSISFGGPAVRYQGRRQ
jgi:hypothetical protein